MVKVCGITRRQDAEAAVVAGASAIGFVFVARSPRCVTPEAAAELGRGLDVWKVGVFENESPASIEAVMRSAKLDVAQIYGGDLPSVPRIWRAFRGETSKSTDGLEAILLDGPANGITFDWNQARGLAEKVIVAGGLDASNVAEAIRIAKPWGVDASSRLESAPGIKDHEKVRRFIDAAIEAGRAGFQPAGGSSPAESKS
ncbi:MAG: phosphoribosylanthranilate isomerase [Bryobacterales bacterium]|nr:phosphoribosylanthranilate isomerase [Bryobacterales bacterium]